MKRNSDKTDLRGQSRRDFVKGVLSASAVLGLGPTRALEVLEQMGGSALAAEGCANVSRVVNIIAGNGGLSWFTMVWPVPKAISGFKASYAYDDPAKAVKIAGIPEGRELYARRFDAAKPPLWENFGAKKRVSCILTGRNVGHENAPVRDGNSNTLKGGVGGPVQVFAGAAAMQAPLQALVPVIGIKFNGADMPYGRAPGSPPPPASVPGANEMVGLFSSSASRLADRLGNVRNQRLFDQYYKAFLSLAKTADRVTYQRAYGDAKVAAQLVGQNLGSKLAVDQQKLQAWCGPAIVDDKVQRMAEALMVTANAFKLGLTAQVTLPVFMDDPHGAFADVARAGRIADGTTRVLQSFLDDLATEKEPTCATRPLSDNVVLTVSGDLPKDPFTRANWPDSTPGGSNWIYVMSNGYIKPGWHGDVTENSKTLFNPRTGQLDGAQPEEGATNAALASVLFAVTQGDDRRVRDFFAGDYAGLVNASIQG
jgi:hypothetical protein